LNKVSIQPTFSVVTVCFNSKATITETIMSVRSQTGVSFEHIVIDGGSTDGTLDILENYRDGIAHIVSEPDEGVYDAMQKGLELANGTFTGFLNADDFFSSQQALLRLLGDFDESECDGLCGVVEQIDENGRTARVIGSAEVTESELLWGKFPPHPGTYLRTEVMKKTGGFGREFRLLGDMDMFLRFKDIAQRKIVFSKETVVKMRLGGLSTRGFATYLAIGQEMLMALNRSGRAASWFKIQLRFLFKLRELKILRNG
jgi:glycosyltransferase involved in cell wall biosynthesis